MHAHATKPYELIHMCAGASCPTSLRALGQLRTFSGLMCAWASCAQGPLALSPCAPLLVGKTTNECTENVKCLFSRTDLRPSPGK